MAELERYGSSDMFALSRNSQLMEMVRPPPPRVSLVLDLDETLVHASLMEPAMYDFVVMVDMNGTQTPVFVQERPGVREFIKIVAREFDLFIFTASMAGYAIPTIQEILPCFPPERVLSRPHCRMVRDVISKDLTIFGRDLSKMVLVDNNPHSFIFQPANGILVPSWYGEQGDILLLHRLLPFLRVCGEADDVRTVISQAFAESQSQ